MAIFQRRNSSTTISSEVGNRSDNRTQWSDKYSAGVKGYVGYRTHVPAWLMTLTVALLIALGAMLIFGMPALSYKGQSEGTFTKRMMAECDDALTLANNLSRNGAADSYATLGRIRSDIHAVNVINEVHNTIAGSYYVQPYVFTNIFSIIDSYNNNLKLGNVTMQNLTDLVNSLNELRVMLEALQ